MMLGFGCWIKWSMEHVECRMTNDNPEYHIPQTANQ